MTEQANANANTNAQFVIQRLYIKNASYEAPNTPSVFQQQWEPDLSLDINTQHTKLDDSTYEVVLTVTTTVKNKETVAFLIEVEQAGIFTIQGTSNDQLDHLLNSFCPNILFPYAREYVTSQVIRGSFPQLVLTPINFDALYMQQLEQKKQNNSAKVTETETTH